MRSTVFPRHWHLPCCSFFSVKPLEATRFRKAGWS
jgi:hypothetical protein